VSRVVVLALGQEALCFPANPATRVVLNGGCSVLEGGHPQAQPVCEILGQAGIRPTAIDTLQQDGCFVLVVLAEIDDGANLQQVSARLKQNGAERGLVLRIQREDVFRAMHRI
jgi:predicted amino acid-binding ACT domain protein